MALEDYKADMERCSRCSYCKFIPFTHVKSWRFSKGCPSIEYGKFQAFSAGGRLSVALALLEQRFGYEDSDSLLDIAYRCMLDGLCDVSDKICRYNIEPLETMRELRFKLVEDGQVLPQHVDMINHLRKEDNMMMKAKTERGKWAEDLDVKDLTKESAEVVFHAGCRFSLDEELWEIPRMAITLLRNAGIDVGIFGKEEACCGGQAYDMGYRGELSKYAQHNIEAWTNAGVKMVVTPCSDGYHAFKRLYPQVGSKFEVFHIVEFIERLLKEGKIKLSKIVPMTVTYHDPCHLGRRGEPYVPWSGIEKKVRGQIVLHEPRKPRYNGINGVYEPPREILRRIPGLKLIEMERIREFAWCCGSGGGVKFSYPEFSLWTAGERVEEACTTGAEAIVTACGWCKRNFLDAVNENKMKMKVYDILEMIQKAI